MEFQHELVIPDEGLPFKFFLFEGSQGNYVREKHWHTSIEIFAVMEGSLTFYLNDDPQPLLVVDQMIHGKSMRGNIGFFVDIGTEAFFKDLKITYFD